MTLRTNGPGRSRLCAFLASVAVTVVPVIGVGGLASADASASNRTILHSVGFVTTADVPGIFGQLAPMGVDSGLGLVVLGDGFGRIVSISTRTMRRVGEPIATPLWGQDPHAAGVVDSSLHRAYLGQAASSRCSVLSAGCAVTSDAVPGPVRPLTPHLSTASLTGDFAPTEYALPASAAGTDIVAMAPFNGGGRHLLYVLVNKVQDSKATYLTGFVHTTTLYQLDADKLALPDTTGALVWSHDVSLCATFSGLGGSGAFFQDFLGIDPAGTFAYFDCRGIQQTGAGSATYSAGGAVVVDFPQPVPTAEQEQAGSFTASFYPAGAPLAFSKGAGDPAAGLLVQLTSDGAHNKLYVFDAVHRAWTGSIPLKGMGVNIWGIAVDPTNGEAYSVTDSDVVAASQVTSLPVRLGNLASMGDLRTGNGAPPLFDPATGRLFVLSSPDTWTTRDGTRVHPDAEMAVFQDVTRFSPVELTPPDPDAFTHEIPVTDQTQVSYQAIGSAYGLRVVQTGGLTATQLAAFANPAVPAGNACAIARQFVPAPCDGLVPSTYDGSRALTLGRSDASTQNSGAVADAAPAELDTSTASEVTQLSSPATFLAGPFGTAGRDAPNAPASPDEPASDQVSQRVAPTTCSDLGTGKSASDLPSAHSGCDSAGRKSDASATTSQFGVASPVQVAYAASNVATSNTPAGSVVDVTAVARGISIDVPGGPSLHIGEVTSRATSRAAGRTGTAGATFNRTISEATVRDPQGKVVVSCGFSTTPACDPRQLTIAMSKNSPFPIQFLTPAPASPYGIATGDDGTQTVKGSPGGAKAEVIKTEYQFVNDANVNGDASHEVPGLQVIMVNDQQQPSRLVLQMAAVSTQASQSIGLAPPRPSVLAAPSLQLHLTDDATPPGELSGATFVLTGPAGTEPLPCLTAADGIGTCTFKALPPGSYTIRETQPPPGFAVADDYQLTLEPGNEYKTSFVNLAAIGSVQLTLSAPGDPGDPLPGGMFAMFKGEEMLAEPIATCTTDEQGACGFDKVPLGEYTMQQVSAPEGFLVSDPAQFSLTKPKQVASLNFVDGVPGREAVPPTVIPGKPAIPPTLIPGKPGVPPRVIPGRPAVPARTMVLPALDGGAGAAALEPVGFDTSAGPSPIVASQPSALGPLDLGSGGLTAVGGRLAKLVLHSPQQAVLLLFVWLVLGMPVYLWVRRRQFITATEGI
jgi:hypothetical protein